MRTTSKRVAADAAGNVEVYPSSSVSSKKKIAVVTTIVILAAVAVAVSVAASGDREVTMDPPVKEKKTFEEQELKPVQVQEDTPTRGPKPVDTPKPTPKPTPSKEEDNNANTMIPTGGATTTVSTEISGPPTVDDRVDRRNMIQSPTWGV